LISRGKILHVANIKGGVGKSTIATNLAACLSSTGRTLVIDLDVQGSSTYALGREPVESGFSSAALFVRRLRNAQSASRPEGQPERRRSAAPSEAEGIPITASLDLLPASPALLDALGRRHLRRLVENLELLRGRYQYVVVDTPSVWNDLIKTLFCASDMNLIPVTLSALSTRSLKDYLREIRRLIRRNPTLRIRIIKNDVYGQKADQNPGKLQTVTENRAYLNSLCELVRYSSGQSTLLLPQSVLFDLEIPDYEAIQSAQDRGIPIALESAASAARTSFELLTRKVIDALERLPNRPLVPPSRSETALFSRLKWGACALAASLVLFVSSPLRDPESPAILCPQQMEQTPNQVFTHAFKPGENLYRLAKYAIGRYRAVVPSNENVESYVRETIEIYNLSRPVSEPLIASDQRDLTGLRVTFYPPGRIRNDDFHRDIPVHQFFLSQVADPYAYVTGIWCEYGEGGGTPHQGWDIAAPTGTPVTTPIGGTAHWRRTRKGGNMVGVAREDYILFYAHLQKFLVRDGQAVMPGDTIGLVGMTGNTSGPHVHVGYGIRYPVPTAVRFGGSYYQVTDPKQFFFRLQYRPQES